MIESAELTDLTDSELLMSHYKGKGQWYFEENYNQSSLVITIGDSWAWGMNLGRTSPTFDDYAYRTSNIFGNLLSKHLSADFINIAFPGLDNITFINQVEHVLSKLSKSYKQIYLIFSLAEGGREFTNTFLNYKELYSNVLSGPDWPTFDEILNDTYDQNKLNFAIDELSNNSIEFIHHLKLYLKVKHSSSVLDLLRLCEEYTLENINNIVKKFLHLNLQCYISRHNTSFFSENHKLFLNNTQKINLRWVDVIAEQGKISPYPDPVYVITQGAIDPLTQMAKNLNINNRKEHLITLLDQSTSSINWLKNSILNRSYPSELGHRWWSDYLYKEIAK